MDNIGKKINTEFQRVGAIVNLENPEVEPIIDGFIDESAYNKSKYKCCFILKEPYDDFDEGKPFGGGWSFSDVLEKWDINDSSGRQSTSIRVAAIVYSINHGFCDTKNLNPEQLKEGFAACYWINLSKTPAYSATRYNKELKRKVKLWSQVVHDQLIQANPDIMLFGYTWDWYYLDFPYNERFDSMKAYPENSSKPKVRIFKAGEDKISVDAYHPGIKNLDYETLIISSIKDYLSLN